MRGGGGGEGYSEKDTLAHLLAVRSRSFRMLEGRATFAERVGAASVIRNVANILKSLWIPHEQRTYLSPLLTSVPPHAVNLSGNQALKDVTSSPSRRESSSGSSGETEAGRARYCGSSRSLCTRQRASPGERPAVTVHRARRRIRPRLERARQHPDQRTFGGLERRQLDEKFDEILEFAELERFVDEQGKNYSSGMLMRFAYSIAIQIPFDVLLLDEVLAVGDRSFQQKCFESSIGSSPKERRARHAPVGAHEPIRGPVLLLKEAGQVRPAGAPRKRIGRSHEAVPLANATDPVLRPLRKKRARTWAGAATLIGPIRRATASFCGYPE